MPRRFSHRSDLEINISRTLEQLLRRFQAVEHGLPELVKNSKDQYARLDIVGAETRPIVVLANMANRTIGVLDFAGAALDDFMKWRVWSDPSLDEDSGSRQHDIEAGNGNGGKAFMTFGSLSQSMFESLRDGRYTAMGFDTSQNSEDRFRPDFALDDQGSLLKDRAGLDPEALLVSSLSDFGIGIEQLPDNALSVWTERKAFTMVKIEGVKEWGSRRAVEHVRRSVYSIPSILAEHPQASLSIESCNVWIVIDGTLVGDRPVKAASLEPREGFESIEPIPIPTELEDPETGESVSTGPGDEESRFLQLHTSAVHLRMSSNSALNVIRVWNGRNIAANWSVADLHPSSESAYIYGRIAAPALQDPEHLAGADRASLASTPLVRALRHWTSQQVQELVERLREETSRDHAEEDRQSANSTLEDLREAMREFLEDEQEGRRGAEQGGEGEGGPGDDSPPPPEFGERVDILVLENDAASLALPVGTSSPLKVRALENREDGNPLPVRVSWADLDVKTENGEAVTLDESGVCKAIAAGTSPISVIHKETGVESNALLIESIACSNAIIRNRPERVLRQGERLPLQVLYETDSGNRADLLVEASVDEENMGRVTRVGTYTAPGRQGSATIRVRYGPRPEDTRTLNVTIGEERVPPPERKGRGGSAGGDIPTILLCGEPVPGSQYEDLPIDERTFHPSTDEPTIIDYDPQFENVIFINPDSHEATQVRARRGGRRGAAGIGTKTFGEFLATKCFEILKRLWVFQQADEAPLTPNDYRLRFAEAEQVCARFVPVAYEIGRRIAERHEEGN